MVAHNWGVTELIESAVRTGRTDLAAGDLQRLTTKAQACRTDWALGIEARSRALLSTGDIAERGFREVIGHLSRARVHGELARAHLLYGEWLRRRKRRVDPRCELTPAYEMFTTMGMEGFAERARLPCSWMSRPGSRLARHLPGCEGEAGAGGEAAGRDREDDARASGEFRAVVVKELGDWARGAAGDLAEGAGRVVVLAGQDRPLARDEQLGRPGRYPGAAEALEELPLGRDLEGDGLAEFGREQPERLRPRLNVASSKFHCGEALCQMSFANSRR
jgi:hypothetical protein